METHNCGSCGELVSEGVHCSVCNQDLHYQCSGITEAGYRKLGPNRKDTWRCLGCKQSGSCQPPSPRIESESLILKELKAISDKLAPLECLKDEVSALRSEFADLKSSLNDTNKELKHFTTKIKNIEQRLVQVEIVQSQVDSVQVRLDKLELESNLNEQWARMNNIELKGIPQANNENLFEVLSKIGSRLQYPIDKSQINFITRVPTRDKDSIKPIIVCFCNRYAKEDFVAAARFVSKTTPLTTGFIGLSGNQSRIYVNDHLTLQNKSLLSKAKKAAADNSYRYVWVKYAKIHVRKNDESHVLVVKSERDISKIV